MGLAEKNGPGGIPSFSEDVDSEQSTALLPSAGGPFGGRRPQQPQGTAPAWKPPTSQVRVSNPNLPNLAHDDEVLEETVLDDRAAPAPSSRAFAPPQSAPMPPPYVPGPYAQAPMMPTHAAANGYAPQRVAPQYVAHKHVAPQRVAPQRATRRSRRPNALVIAMLIVCIGIFVTGVVLFVKFNLL